VVVSGYYGFGNAGDELILAALCRALAGHEVTVLSADPAATRREHGVGAIARTDLAGIARAVARCDLLVSGGGGLLQDATGPGSIPYYLGVIVLGRLLRRPVMVYAQGIGPLRRGWARAALRLLRGVQAVTVRDAESAELLQRAGVRHAEVTADAVLALPRPVRGPDLAPELAAAGVAPGETLVAVAPRPYGGPEFAARLARAADLVACRLGARVVLVPMQPQEDLAFCERIAAAMRQPAATLRDVPALRYPAVFAHFHLVVGMRLHALILAALCRVPCVGLSYDPKIEAFAHSLGGAAAVLGLGVAPEEVAARVEGLFPPAPAAAAALDAAVTRLEAAARRNDECLRALLDRTRAGRQPGPTA
jgi:polysaccharide pyruvyl transferase CsaB